MMWWTKSEDKKRNAIFVKLNNIIQLMNTQLQSLATDVDEIKLKLKKKIFREAIKDSELEEVIEESEEKGNDDGFDSLRALRKDLKP